MPITLCRIGNCRIIDGIARRTQRGGNTDKALGGRSERLTKERGIGMNRPLSVGQARAHSEEYLKDTEEEKALLDIQLKATPSRHARKLPPSAD